MEEAGNHLMQQLQGNPFPLPMHPNSHASQMSGSCAGFGAEADKRSGVPPASPHSQFLSPASRSPPMTQHLTPAGPLHSRARSQPALFSLDSPPTNSDSVSADASMDDHDAPSSRSRPLPPTNPAAAAVVATARDGLPPRKAHRRSQSDVPFAFFAPSLPVRPAAAAPLAAGFLHSAKLAAGGVKVESHGDRGFGAGGVTGDDLFNAYMNLQGFDGLTSSEDNHEDLNSRESGSKANAADSSDNEVDSITGLCSTQASRKEGMKRSAGGDPALVMTASSPCRSLSMDSSMGKFNFAEEPTKLLPSPGLGAAKSSKANSLDGDPNTFSLEFGNGQFTAAEMKKIMENEKLVEMAMTDPKRVKRILANRHSAARSKERKMRYIVELEHKVQALQTETTTLSAQLTLLQRDSAGLINQNKKLKFRLQAMEQQAQLRDALNEALTAEVQHLKLAATGLADADPSDNIKQQTSINPEIFQLQLKQQHPHMHLYQLQKQQNDAAMDTGSE